MAEVKATKDFGLIVDLKTLSIDEEGRVFVPWSDLVDNNTTFFEDGRLVVRDPVPRSNESFQIVDEAGGLLLGTTLADFLQTGAEATGNVDKYTYEVCFTEHPYIQTLGLVATTKINVTGENKQSGDHTTTTGTITLGEMYFCRDHIFEKDGESFYEPIYILVVSR